MSGRPAGSLLRTDLSLKDIDLNFLVMLRTYMYICTSGYDFQNVLNHHDYVAFCDFILCLIVQKLLQLETSDSYQRWNMTSSETYFIPKSIGLWTSAQIAVKNSVSSSSPNFDDKCVIELKC